MQTRTTALLVVTACVACASPPPPYLGTWVPDASGTDMTRMTFTYEAVDPNTYRVTVDNQTFEMKLDGTETESPWGGTLASRTLDSLSWETTWRLEGRVIGVDTAWLSADGQALTSRSHRPTPDGATNTSEMKMTRTGGGPGLAGTWSGATASGAMMGEVAFAAAGDSGIAINYAAMNATCSPHFDGADAKAASPMFDDGWTCAMAIDSAGQLSISWKRAGEPRYVSAYSVSADGNTLTEVGTAVGVDEPVTMVYHRKAAGN